jgi:lipopolysaccharide transport system permease protein
MASTGQGPTWRLATLPVLAVWSVALALSTTLVVCAVSVRRRDALSALPIAIQVWLYVSPIAYPLTSVHGVYRHLIGLNPLTALIEAHRWAITGRTGLGPFALGYGIASTVVLLVVGLAAFRVAERSMADVL